MKKLGFSFLLASLVLTSQVYAGSSEVTPDIFITAVGDVMMGTDYPRNTLPENEGRDLFAPAKAWLDASDIRFANLEGTLFDGPLQPDGKAGGANRYLFRTPTSYGERLFEAGFNMISMANNHVNDFGQAGVNSTKLVLKNLSLQYSSKGGEVALVTVKDVKVAMIAVDFYRGRRSMVDPANTFREIQTLKQNGYLVVVSAHAGGEGAGAEVIPQGVEKFLGENRGNSIEFARGCIDVGADAIVMHGPHVPRAMELYRDRLIMYSLGNFVTGPGIGITGLAGLAPLVRFQLRPDGSFVRAQIVSFVQKRGPHRIEIDRQAKAYKLIRKLSEEQFQAQGLTFRPDGIILNSGTGVENESTGM